MRAYSPSADADVDVKLQDGLTSRSGGDGAEVHFSAEAVSLYDQDIRRTTTQSSHNLGPSSESDEDVAPAPNEFYSPDEGAESGENIPSYDEGRGYRVQCADGMYSQSGGIQEGALVEGTAAWASQASRTAIVIRTSEHRRPLVIGYSTSRTPMPRPRWRRRATAWIMSPRTGPQEAGLVRQVHTKRTKYATEPWRRASSSTTARR